MPAEPAPYGCGVRLDVKLAPCLSCGFDASGQFLSPQVIEARMRGLARALALAEPHERLSDIGPRLFMHRSADAVLSLDGCDYLLRVPIGGDWARFVCAGGTVTLAVGLDPLPAGAPLQVVDAYLTQRVTEGRLFLGKTRAEQPRKALRPGVIPVRSESD